MGKFGLVLFLIMLVGCASGEKPVDNSTSATTGISTTESGADSAEDNQSKVLNKNKKCPKNSKLVNGKCMLQVESND